jgi:hypothetical protein
MKFSYVAALDPLTREQQKALVAHYAEQNDLYGILFG